MICPPDRARNIQSAHISDKQNYLHDKRMKNFIKLFQLPVPVFVANMDAGHGGTCRQPHGGEFAKVAFAPDKFSIGDALP